jgi:hypothetical protein
MCNENVLADPPVAINNFVGIAAGVNGTLPVRRLLEQVGWIINDKGSSGSGNGRSSRSPHKQSKHGRRRAPPAALAQLTFHLGHSMGADHAVPIRDRRAQSKLDASQSLLADTVPVS